MTDQRDVDEIVLDDHSRDTVRELGEGDAGQISGMVSTARKVDSDGGAIEQRPQQIPARAARSTSVHQ